MRIDRKEKDSKKQGASRQFSRGSEGLSVILRRLTWTRVIQTAIQVMRIDRKEKTAKKQGDGRQFTRGSEGLCAIWTWIYAYFIALYICYNDNKYLQAEASFFGLEGSSI